MHGPCLVVIKTKKSKCFEMRARVAARPFFPSTALHTPGGEVSQRRRIDYVRSVRAPRNPLQATFFTKEYQCKHGTKQIAVAETHSSDKNMTAGESGYGRKQTWGPILGA